MNKFSKSWLLIAAICLLLATLVGCNTPLGEIFDPSGNPFAHRFSDVTDIRTATYVVAASDSEHKYEADYTCSGASDEVTIEALVAAGTTVKLLDGTFEFDGTLDIMYSDFKLEGSGPGTIIQGDLTSLDYIKVGDGSTALDHVIISNLKIDGSSQLTAGTGIYFHGASGTLITYSAVSDCWIDGTVKQGVYFVYVDYSIIQNVTGVGNWSSIRADNCDYGAILNNICLDDTVYGIYGRTLTSMRIEGNYCKGAQGGINLYATHESSIIGNVCSDTTGTGIDCNASGTGYNTFSNNVCWSNNTNGIDVGSGDGNTFTGNVLSTNGNYGLSGNGADYLVIADNYVHNNGEDGIRLTGSKQPIIEGNLFRFNAKHGIYLDTTSGATVVGNTFFCNSQATDNTYSGLYLNDADYCTVVSNTFRQGTGAKLPKYGIEVTANALKCVIRANNLYDAGKTANLGDAGVCTVVSGNYGTEITDERILVQAKNTSGGELVAGDVVILKAVAAGNEITTTTVEGDQMVFGMVAETIADAASGLVLVEGKTIVLKVDGTADISIGDFIGCFTTAKIGMKAAAGKMAFAIALEAYTTDDSSGVIDALLIVPRQAI